MGYEDLKISSAWADGITQCALRSDFGSWHCIKKKKVKKSCSHCWGGGAAWLPFYSGIFSLDYLGPKETPSFFRVPGLLEALKLPFQAFIKVIFFFFFGHFPLEEGKHCTLTEHRQSREAEDIVHLCLGLILSWTWWCRPGTWKVS